MVKGFPPVVDAGGYRLFQGIDSPGERFSPVHSERGEFREVRGRGQQGAIILFEQNGIGQHQVNPRSFLILATSPRSPTKLIYYAASGITLVEGAGCSQGNA